MITQKRIKGLKRIPAWSCLHPTLKQIILHDANKFDCSPSFVIATALAEFFKFHKQDKYYEVGKKRKRVA